MVGTHGLKYSFKLIDDIFAESKSIIKILILKQYDIN